MISTGVTPRPAGQVHRDRAARPPLNGRLQDGHQLGGVAEDFRDVPAAGGVPGRGAQQRFGGAVEGDHAAIEVEGDDPVDQRVENVIGVALQVGQLGKPAAELPVGRLERRPLLEERRALLVKLPRHLVEGGRQLPDLVPRRRLDPLDQLPPRDRDRAGRQLPDGPRDPAGDQGRREARPGQDEDGQKDQLAPRGGDLRLHPAAREPHPGRAPALGVDPDRHREVVERLPVRSVELLRQGRVRGEDAVERAAGEERAHDLGAVVVGRDAPVAIEDHRVGNVGLGGDARHVLLELRVVVEDERSRGPHRQIPRQRVPAPLDLADDGLALPVLDDDHQRAHDRGDDEEGADQELRLEGDEAAPRPARGRSVSRARDGRMRAGRLARSSRSPCRGPPGAARRK